MIWLKRAYYWLRNIKRSIKSLIKWFPIIWKDRDWDHEYILYLLKAKLEFMIDNFSKTQFYEGWEKDVAEMKEALAVLDRILADDYFIEADELAYSRDWNNDEVVAHMRDFNDEEEMEQYSKEVLECCEIEEMLLTRDYNKFFTLLAKNMKHWWW